MSSDQVDPAKAIAGQPGDRQIAAKRPNDGPTGDSPEAHRSAAPTHRDSRPPSTRNQQSQQHTTTMGRTLPFNYLVGGPYKVQPMRYRPVIRTELDNFFKCLFGYMNTNYYSTTAPQVNPVITEENFVLVCQYHFAARIHAVNSKVTARRHDGFIRLSTECQMPKPLVDVLMQYGRISVLNDLVIYVPAPWKPVEDASKRLTAQVGFDLLQAFSTFANMCESRGKSCLIYVSFYCQF
jgi:hypothetical protein